MSKSLISEVHFSCALCLVTCRRSGMIRRLYCRPTCRVFAGWSLPFSPLPLLSMTPDKCHKVESFFSLCLIPSHCARDKREASSKDCPCRRSIGPLRRRCSCFASNSEDRIHRARTRPLKLNMFTNGQPDSKLSIIVH